MAGLELCESRAWPDTCPEGEGSTEVLKFDAGSHVSTMHTSVLAKLLSVAAESLSQFYSSLASHWVGRFLSRWCVYSWVRARAGRWAGRLGAAVSITQGAREFCGEGSRREKFEGREVGHEGGEVRL